MWRQVLPATQKTRQTPRKSSKREKQERQALYIYSSYLLENLQIDNKTKQEILFSMFGKWSRKQLTLNELEHFVSFLEQKYYNQ